MRLFRILIAASLVLAGLQAQVPEDLVGRWRSLVTSKGGIGGMYEFHANGTVDFSPGAVVEMKYRLAGDQLFLATAGEKEQPMPFSWTQDGKLRMGPALAVEELRRVGPAATPGSLTGEWLGERDMDGNHVPVRWIFSSPSAGQALLLIAFKTEKGNFVVRSGGIAASFAGGGVLQGSYVIKDGVLTLTRSGSREQRFGRY